MYQEQIWHFFFLYLFIYFFGEGRIWHFIERIWHINIHPHTHIYIYKM